MLALRSIPSRSNEKFCFHVGDYSFGFNGKDKESEFNSGAYDFGARIHDARLGRWMSVDPKWQLYKSQSPFGYAKNSPCFYVDRKGETVVVGDQKSLETLNTAIQHVFAGNEVVTKLLTISAETMTMPSIISQADYESAMSSLDTEEKKAIFRGLYLASTSKTEFNFQVVGDGESAFVNGTALSSADIHLKYDGVCIGKETDSFEEEILTDKVDIAVSTEEAGSMKAPLSIRNIDAMAVGSILSAYITCDPRNQNDNSTVPYNPNTSATAGTLVGVQTENLVLSALNQSEFDGTDFAVIDPNGKPNSLGMQPLIPLDKEQLKKVSDIPDQLRFQFYHFSSGVVLRDEIQDRNIETSALSKVQVNE